ncbi:MAG TPA: glycosyltransferase family 39 protein [Solirubrobacterales bacterium]|nr:glycosyltransferase family 39 protein [Solirubrobacterales bacterium]
MSQPVAVAERIGERRGVWLAVGTITALALVLRAVASQQALAGDELYTYRVVSAASLGGVFDGIELTEATPPLYYVLAWLAGMLGDAPGWIRLPSILYGAASVPVVYLLGERFGGRRAGLVAALLIAVAPFAIVYGSEARAYGGLLFLLPLSTYALLRATDERGGEGRGALGWWVLLWVATTAALYTHYTASFAIVVQALWVLWRRRESFPALAGAYLAVAVAYLPWLGEVGQNPDLAVPAPFGLFDIEPLGRLLGGHPGEPLGELPGFVGALLLAAAAAVVAYGIFELLRRATPRGRRRWSESLLVGAGRRPGLVLLAALAIALPLGLGIYSEIRTPLLNPRNLTGALPYLLVLVGVLTAVIRPPLTALAAGLATLALALGSASVLAGEAQRPQWKAAAELIEAEAEPGSTVVYVSLAGIFRPGNDPSGPFASADEHPLVQELPLYIDEGFELERDVNDEKAWRGGGTVYVAYPRLPLFEAAVREQAERSGAVLESRTVLEGQTPIVVSAFAAGAGQAP